MKSPGKAKMHQLSHAWNIIGIYVQFFSADYLTVLVSVGSTKTLLTCLVIKQGKQRPRTTQHIIKSVLAIIVTYMVSIALFRVQKQFGTILGSRDIRK